MKRLALALILCSLSSCQQRTGVEIEDVWARDTVGSSANAAVFMTITSDTADRLVGASTPAADRTDLMTMAGGDSAMAMEYVKAIDLPPGQAVSLNPRGLHVWLAGLKAPLKAGEAIPLTLQFEKAGERQVSVSVIAPTAPAPTPNK